MRKVIWQARCLHMVIKEELEELNRRTDVSQWLLKRVMLNDPDPEEDEESSSSPLGVVTMLINRFLTPAAGRVAGTIVCVVVGILVYVILLLAARNMREEELNSSLFGRLLLRVGRLIHFY